MRTFKWFHTFTLLGVLLCLTISYGQNVPYEKKMLIPGVLYNTTLDYEQKLCIYCYRGVQKHILNIWQTAYITINLEPNEYDLYLGSNSHHVLQMYEVQKSSWTNRLFSWKSDKISLDPFNLNCIGIDTSLDHSVLINVIRIDFWRVLRFVSGIFIFLAAPRFSANPLFYYICGISLGIVSFFFIGIYFISKLIPHKKPMVYAAFSGGWVIGVYLIQVLWQNLKTVAIIYQKYVLMYIGLTGLISFVVCYRMGPVTDPRSRNLIKWGIQTASLFLIFYSSRCPEAASLFVVFLLLYYNFPRKWILSFLTLWRRTFPAKIKLLTIDEYQDQGEKETAKALANLRKYCSSPDCNQWKTVLKLKEPKSRFAEFMEGSFHLSSSEISTYESDSYKSVLLTDDSDINDDANED